MLNNKFVLKSESSNITIKGGFLNRITYHSGKPASDYRPDINFIMEESTSLEAFEMEMRAAIKTQSFYSYLVFLLKNRIGSVLTLVIALVVIILIALLSIHGSLTYDLFSGGESSNILDFNGIYLYLMLSLIILLFLIVSPRIILGEYNNLFDWANSRFSTNTRIIRRLSRELNLMHKVYGQDKELNVWNPLVAGTDTWICTQLLPALSMLSSQVIIMIRTDEKDALLEIMKINGLEKRYTNQPIDQEDAVNRTLPFHLLSTWEKECIHCLLFSSIINLPEGWKESGGERNIIISKELAERVYHLYSPKLSSRGSGHTTFEKFMNRCVFDYA